ncbi:hypothetical protein L218DRAFT_948169 [Marasmius fiardii PR-910]|nr:hypothetical protein L218DRAFT_948169 [Marasmius fiardii PR-910]
MPYSVIRYSALFFPYKPSKIAQGALAMAPRFSKVLDPDTDWSDLPPSSPEGDWGPYHEHQLRRREERSHIAIQRALHRTPSPKVFKRRCIFIASPSTDNPLSSPALPSMSCQSFTCSEMPPLIFPSTTSPVTSPAAPPTPEHDTVLPMVSPTSPIIFRPRKLFKETTNSVAPSSPPQHSFNAEGLCSPPLKAIHTLEQVKKRAPVSLETRKERARAYSHCYYEKHKETLQAKARLNKQSKNRERLAESESIRRLEIRAQQLDMEQRNHATSGLHYPQILNRALK